MCPAQIKIFHLFHILINISIRIHIVPYFDAVGLVLGIKNGADGDYPNLSYLHAN